MQASSKINTTLIPRPKAQAMLGGVSESCIWRWERNKRMGFPAPVKINNRIYYREQELEAFIERQTMRGLDGSNSGEARTEAA